MECILLYVELDKPDPVIDELIPILSNKQPKLIAATLTALTSIYRTYGCKTVDPKPVIKLLPKIYGHADKNVRAEGQNLTVEFYRWLKDSMKPLFWSDLKPVQQQDLEKLFDKVKEEPTAQPERLLRSQQASQGTGSAIQTETVGEDGEDEVHGEQGDELEFMAVNVWPKIPKDFQDRINSSKWKDRKDALDELHKAVDCPSIEDGHFDEIVRSLAKCMKDANIAVVTAAANCIELLAKGLKRAFSKHRSAVMAPIMERLKEKKQSVADALGAALDGVFVGSGLSDCLSEGLDFLGHKNPQVKLESTRFLIRCLKTTKEAPTPAESKMIADAAAKLLTDSQEAQRSAGAECLGTLWKIMGDRIMMSHLDGLDEIRKTKIKEYYESAEVKSKYKPKAAPAKAAPSSTQKRTVPGKRPATATAKKPASSSINSNVSRSAAVISPTDDAPTSTLTPRPSGRPGTSKVSASRTGLVPPVGSRLQQPKSSSMKPPTSISTPSATPKRQQFAGADEGSVPAPKFGLANRGLASRPLTKPGSAPVAEAPVENPMVINGVGAVERAELENLRSEVENLRSQNEEIRMERTRLTSTVHELQNQNAQLIEDHTRDVLSIKAKETQLVRARSDAEAAEQTVQMQQREMERLKRELSSQIRAVSPAPIDVTDQIFADGANAMNGAYSSSYGRTRPYAGLSNSNPNTNSIEGKENAARDLSSRKLNPSIARDAASSLNSGRGGSSGNGAVNEKMSYSASTAVSNDSIGSAGSDSLSASGNGTESWKRAAEVTQNLKARIEQMKVRIPKCGNSDHSTNNQRIGETRLG